MGQVDGLPQFVGEMAVGQHIAFVQRLDGAGDLDSRRRGGRFGRFRTLRDAFNPAFVAGDDEVEGDGVAGFESAQFAWVADFEGHGHGGHVVGDGFVPDDDGFAVRFQFPDEAVDGEGALGRRRRGGVFVAGGQDEHGPARAAERAADGGQYLLQESAKFWPIIHNKRSLTVCRALLEFRA